MTDKHTPGPWFIDDEGSRKKGYVSISSKGHTGLAEVVWWMEDDEMCGVASPACEANARLIAKAPELHALALRIARLNRDAGEIGAGMLASLVDEARGLTDES